MCAHIEGATNILTLVRCEHYMNTRIRTKTKENNCHSFNYIILGICAGYKMSHEELNRKLVFSLSPQINDNMEIPKDNKSLLNNQSGGKEQFNLRLNHIPSLPEYQNLPIDCNNIKNMGIPPITVQSPTKHVNLSLVPGTRSLPPRPVPQATKPSKCNSQSSCDTLKSGNGRRHTSPNSSVISILSSGCRQSPTSQHGKQLNQICSNNSTLKRPHVLHRTCALNSIQLEKLANNGPLIDVVIVYSKECRVSADWARYFRSLFEGASYGNVHLASSSNGRTRDTVCGNRNSSDVNNLQVAPIKVQLQEIEAFSTKVYQMNSSVDHER